MNKDQIAGKVNQVAGRIREKTGEALGDQHLANQGVAQQVKGVAEETWGKAKAGAHEIEKRLRREAGEKANAARHKIVEKATHLKEQAGSAIDRRTEQVRRKPA